MAENEQFQRGNSGGPGRDRKIRLQVGQWQLEHLAEKVLEIGLTSPNEVVSIAALQVLVALVTADSDTTRVTPYFAPGTKG